MSAIRTLFHPFTVCVALLGAIIPIDRTIAAPLRARTWRPSHGVHAIAQTPDGYLWLGTRRGLARFDGESFTFFDPKNTPALGSDKVRALVVDDAGKLWIGLEVGGLVVYRSGRFTRFRGLDDVEVRALEFDPRGRLWAGTSRGLARLEAGTFTRDGVPAPLSHEPIRRILPTAGGGFQVVGASVVAEVGADGIVAGSLTEATNRALSYGHVAALARPADEALVTRLAADERGAPRELVDALRARDGSLWLGGYDGIVVHGPHGPEYLSVDRELPDNLIEALFEDREGSVWVGTRAGGVARIRRASVTGWSKEDGLAADTVFSVVEAPDGAIWMTTGEGFARRGADGIRNYDERDGLPDNDARWLAAGPDGSIFVATYSAGLVRIKGGRLRAYSTRDGLAHDGLGAVLVDREGVLWVGVGTGGLARSRDQERFEHVALGGAPCSVPRTCAERIEAMIERRAGGLALGTTSAGLILYAGGQPSRVTTRQGLPNDGVRAIHEDETGALWVGTAGGLARVKDGAVTSFANEAALPRDVHAIVEDGNRFFWICGEHGVRRVARGALEARAQGQAAELSVVSFGVEDGMPSEECFRSFNPIGARTRDGRLLFATLRGLAVFSPPEREPILAAPAVLIERARMNEQDVAVSAQGTLDVPPGSGAVEIKYTAPTFVGTERVRFRYRLEGFDERWTDAGGRRTAYYTNLAPRSYRFVVEAWREEHRAAATTAALGFRLRPRFVQTLWFRGLLVAAVFAAGLGAHRVRERIRRARAAAFAEERRRIARDLHDDLGQVFSAIGFHVDSLSGQLPAGNQATRARLKQLREMVAHGRIAARQVVFDLKSQDGEQQRPLADALGELGRVYAEGMVSVEVSGTARPIATLVANELLLIAQEATSNAIQHGRARQVRIELQFGPGATALWIRDDGAGFSPEDPAAATGAGLPGMRARAQRVGGYLLVESEPGAGTEIGVVIGAQAVGRKAG